MIDSYAPELPLTERFSCQEHLLPGASLQQKWEVARRAELNAIELRCERDQSFDERHAEVRRAAADGVVMPTVCVDLLPGLNASAVEQRRAAARRMRSQLSMIAAVGAETVVAPISYGRLHRPLSPAEQPNDADSEAGDRGILLDAVRELAEHAEREGVVLALEPLNRYENRLINTLADAVTLCKEIGLPSIRIAADTYHMNIEEADPPGALLNATHWLGHVQLSDSNRLEPGRGHLDWPLLMGTLNAIGYSGWLALECRPSGDAADVLHRSVALLRTAVS
jgi:sugar phosphate isomerase/epimerase